LASCRRRRLHARQNDAAPCFGRINPSAAAFLLAVTLYGAPGDDPPAPQSRGAPILLQTASRGWRPNPRRAGVIFWFREAGLSKPNRNLSRRPAVQTDRSSAGRDHVARCLSSHLSIIERTHRADGEDTPARRARWIMRTCLLLMWSDSNHSEDAVKSFPTTRMRRLWARHRSIEWPRHVGVRSAWHHARTPVCP
jgi:hypothetical protein